MIRFELLGRKSAEVASFLLSSGIILGLLIYLGMAYNTQESPDFLDMKASVLTEKIRRSGAHYIIPIKLENKGEKTPVRARFRIEVSGANYTIDVEYLSRKSSKMIYWTHEQEVRGPDIKVTLESYQF
ncbi:MAG TPA: hypothetical protein VNJ08_01155 [Bacteriovoracaceae bacterium]|nr:hypothetical protein [Bacteriovoracaceae bacterium]